VATGDTLVITPGVDVIFLGHYKLLVDSAAVLKALGTVTDSIRFLPSDTGEWSPGWHGIRFYYASDACSLSYCEMAYGFAYGLCEDDSCGGAIWSYYSNPTFEHCLIRDCWANYNGGAIYMWNSVTVISDCSIKNSISDASGGGFYGACTGEINIAGIISDCNIENNHAYGYGGGVYYNAYDLIISYNSITNNIGNSGAGISFMGIDSVEIIGNIVDSNIGIGIGASGYGRIADNIVSNNQDAGIHTGGVHYIDNNEINGNLNFGIYCFNEEGTIINNLIYENTGEEAGGIHCEYSSPHIINNIIVNNTGGGIYTHWNHDGSIIGNYIAGNISSDQGGGIYCSHVFSGTWNLMPEINSNIITGNSASQGGGIWSSNEPRISNNLIFANTATSGAGIYMTGKPCIVNNTIVNNNGDGCYFTGYYKGMLNTIVYGNTGYEIYAEAPCSVGFAYCDIDTDDVFGSVILWGPGVIDANPLFEDTLFHLAEGSPCINAGVGNYYFPTVTEDFWADTFDFEKGIRPYEDYYDIGADEYGVNLIHERGMKPGNFSLSAHPNPFNSAVKINIDLPSVETQDFASLQIEIFDLNGRMVAQLPSPSVPLPGGEGGYSFSHWEKVAEGRMRAFVWQPAPSLGSGVYLVRARADGGAAAVKRIIYLK